MKDYLKIYSVDNTKKNERKFTDNFIQINRSHIINFNKVNSFGKNHLIIGKKEFNLSEKYEPDFGKYIE